MRKLLTALILGAALMVFFGNALAGEKAYVPKDNEELYGTWVNMDYKTADPPQKLTYKSDGTIYSSIYAESRMLLWKTKFQITAKWKDSEGNIWYKGHWVVVDTGQEGFSLYKISNSGKTCEYIFAHNECPTKVDTEHRNYRIYYRKAEEMAKEGSDSGKNYVTGTSKVLPMGKERLQLNYEGSGIYVSDTEEGFLNNASVHALGTLHAVKGAFEESGSMVVTAPNGDKAFTTYKGSGNLGKSAKGTFTYVGGTGKYTGIKGGGEFTRLHLQPVSKGVWSATTLFKGNWKLP